MGDRNNANQDRYVVPGLERGLRLLQAFSRQRPRMSLSELARAVDLPRSTTYRLLFTLERMGFLSRDDIHKTYRLAPRVLSLGFDFLVSQELVEIARTPLEELSAATGASSHLGIRDGREVVYLHRVAGRKHLVSNVVVGTRFPAHATTMGRVLLFDLDGDELAALFGNAPLARATPHTPGSLGALRQRLAAERKQGFALSVAAFEPGVSSLAAPVRDAEGRVAAAINVTGPASVFDQAALEGAIREHVCDTAARISAWLGHRQKTEAA